MCLSFKRCSVKGRISFVTSLCRETADDVAFVDRLVLELQERREQGREGTKRGGKTHSDKQTVQKVHKCQHRLPSSNLAKITSSNICRSRGFLHRASALAQSLLVSVRLNKAGELQKKKKKKASSLSRCNRSTPHGAKKKKKVNLC